MYNSITLTDRIVERFWKRVNILGPDDCWEWKASLFQTSGYGRFSIAGKNLLAHRVSWVIRYGEIPDGLFACHICDNRKCVNFSHIFLGTNMDNMRDMSAKGRTGVHRGEKNFLSKLKESDIPEIHQLLAEGVSQKKIASRFGVVQTTISRVKLGKIWSWLK